MFQNVFSLTFQVIRRGDRRPFYAPAKYVSEIHPAEIEAMRRKYAGSNNNNGVTSDPNPSDSDSSVGRHKVRLSFMTLTFYCQMSICYVEM